MREHRILFKELGRPWVEDTRRFKSRASAKCGTAWYYRQPRPMRIKIRSFPY